jgi:hypothetical protein
MFQEVIGPHVCWPVVSTPLLVTFHSKISRLLNIPPASQSNFIRYSRGSVHCRLQLWVTSHVIAQSVCQSDRRNRDIALPDRSQPPQLSTFPFPSIKLRI